MLFVSTAQLETCPFSRPRTTSLLLCYQQLSKTELAVGMGISMKRHGEKVTDMLAMTQHHHILLY